MHKGLEASLRHVVFDQFVDINWIPDGPISKRPTKRLQRLRRGYNTSMQNRAASFQDSSDDVSDAQTTVVTETEGNWQIRWLKHPLEGDNNAMEVVEDKLQQIFHRREVPTAAISGLGENAVRDLVGSFVASGLEYWTEERYEEQHDEDFVEEDDWEYHDGGKGNQEDINQAEKEGGEDLIEIPIEGAPTLYKL